MDDKTFKELVVNSCLSLSWGEQGGCACGEPKDHPLPHRCASVTCGEEWIEHNADECITEWCPYQNEHA